MTFQNTVNDPLDDVLEHHGVKGQKWGVRRRDPGSQAQRSELTKTRINNRAAVRKAYQQHAIRHPTNSQIHNARAELHKHHDSVARARANYKVSKAQYKVDKQKMGRTQAKLILEKNGKLSLQKAKARRDAVYNTARKETTGEAVNRIINQLVFG